MSGDNAPLAWWEEVQVSLLEKIVADDAALAARVARYRKHPAEWRADRAEIRRIHKEKKS